MEIIFADAQQKKTEKLLKKAFKSFCGFLNIT